MTYRTVAGLAAALVVFGALALVAQYDPQPDTPGGRLLLPELGDDLDRVTRMTVTGAGAQPVATLERSDAIWSVVERDGYPADVEKVRHTLIGLAEARIVEAKTANPEFYDRLGVEDVDSVDAGGVAVTLTGARSPVNVIVGDSEGVSQTYVREAEQAQSFLIDRDPQVGRNTTDWLATEILAIPGSRVARVTVTHPDDHVVSVSKADAGQINFDVEAIPPDRELQSAGVANVMGTVLSNLSLQDVEPRGDTDVPVTVTEFLTFDGLAITAESLEREDEAWVAFRVEYRAPAEPRAEEPEPESATEQGTEAGDEAAGEDDGVDVAAEAQELDQRLAGWRYRIARYQHDQMTRRMSDLLRDPPDDPPADD